MKKAILFLFAAVFAMPSNAKVGDTFASGNINYKVTIENGSSYEVAVSSPQSTEITSATIPLSVSYDGKVYKVTGIGHKAFENCTNLKSISLPASIEWIGADSFEGCTSLATISIPASVVSIGRLAFAGSSALAKVTFASDIERMGDGVFLGCTAIKSVTLPQGFSKVGSGMFERCSALASVNFADGITTIGDYALAGVSVSSITIPSGTEKIGDGAFAFSEELATVSIPNSINSIGSDAFQGSCALTHTTLPSWLTSLGEDGGVGVFDGCNQMTEITIPAYVENLGNLVTASTALTSVFVMGDHIPAGLASLPCTNAYGEAITIYVKQSVYENNYPDGTWLGHTVDYRIPITMTNAKGNGVKYKTLCRDFDIDLSQTNDELETGVGRLSAYLAPGADEGLGIVFMEEINYIPSRLKANEQDYQGEDEYVGIVLRGTPGATYYYMMGENDYTRGIGQWMLEDATAAINVSPWNANLMRGAHDARVVTPTETDAATGKRSKNFGLSNNAFHAYSKTGWLGYGKAYLSVPESMNSANITMLFTDIDGSTDSISLEEFTKQCDDGTTYDLLGRKVNGNHKGGVIKNGMKRIK